mgnify:CR=1 FL=1
MTIKHYGSGSKGNAIQVDNVLIDAGLKVNADAEWLVITHAHIDHIRHITHHIQRVKHFYAPSDVLQSIMLKTQKWSNKRQNTLYEQIDKKFTDLPDWIKTFPLNHDVPCVGYKINDYVHITDTGEFEIPDFIRNQRFYTIESNYDDVELDLSGRPLELIDRIRETHLSNEEAIALAINLNAKDIMFVHLSDETNSPLLAKTTHDLIAPNNVKKYPQGEEIYNA